MGIISSKKFLIIVILAIWNGMQLYAQMPRPEEDKGFESMLGFNISYGGDFPMGDMAERFGSNLKVLVGMEFITKSNFSVGFDYIIYFGNTVKEDPLEPYRNNNGHVFGLNNDIADVFIRQRAYALMPYLAKTFPFKDGSRSGLKISLGTGLFVHQIRFVDDTRTVAQLIGSYRNGHDRLSRGFAIMPGIGYQFHSSDGLLNGNIMIEWLQSATRQVREVNFESGERITDRRNDMLLGLRATFTLPIYKSDPAGKVRYY
jgi:hypothetical protein